MAAKNRKGFLIGLIAVLVAVVLIVASFFLPAAVSTSAAGIQTETDITAFLGIDNASLLYLFVLLPILGTGFAIVGKSTLSIIGTAVTLPSVVYCCYCLFHATEPFRNPDSIAPGSSYGLGAGSVLILAAYAILFLTSLVFTIIAVCRKGPTNAKQK